MKPIYFFKLNTIIIALLAFPLFVLAKGKRKLPCDELNINEGIMSHYQITGIGEGPLRMYMDLPSLMTGAAFITYKKYLSNKAALSISVGLDNQRGLLSYGNPKMYTYSGGSNSSGEYKRRSYTAAIGYIQVYKKKGRFSSYGYIGVGYTYSFEKYKFNDSINYQYFFLRATRNGVLQSVQRRKWGIYYAGNSNWS